MTNSAAAIHVIPAGLITHSIVVIKGQHHDHDISVHHARTPDARMSITLAGLHMVIYNCQTAQGLLEAFIAARGHLLHVPAQIPSIRADALHEPAGRVMLSIEWTRRPVYAVAAQSTLNRLKTAQIHWVELYTGPVTWQVRDRAGLHSIIEVLGRVHQTAVAVFDDGDQYQADPADPDYRAA
jgi:hypothetical protein